MISVIERLRDRRRGEGEVGADSGFTLIELMVVLLILAILLAIAIPTFLGVTVSANDRAAQSNLNTALLNAKASYQQNQQSFNGINPATLTADEPSLAYVSTNSTGQGVISIYTSGDGNGIVLTAYSKSGTCWVLADNTSGITTNPVSATTYTNATAAGSVPVGSGTQYGKIPGASAALCTAAGPLALNGGSYSTTGFPS